MTKEKLIFITVTTIFLLFLLIFTSINLFKTEYDDPPYNYLTKNWLNSPIKEIELTNNYDTKTINDFDNQNILINFQTDSEKRSLNAFQGKYFNIKTDSSYKYSKFVGFNKNKEGNKICGKDSQGNILYFPNDQQCPLNLILISNNNTACDILNINCKYQKLNNDLYLVTSNEYINGEIITQLRVNLNNKICANSQIDLTFNDLIENYPKKICEENWGYDSIYHEIGQENINDLLKENGLNSIKILKDENITLSYRGYLGVDDFNNFSEHPVDHVTYARKISVSKNIILFISCFYFVFYSIFFLLYEEKNKFICLIKIIFYVYCILFIFNFLYDAHVIFTYFRVKGIVSTVNLDGIKSYKDRIKGFIIFDILILLGLSSDFGIKLYKFIKFRRNHNNIINNNDNN
jgi:hypothetical protein